MTIQVENLSRSFGTLEAVKGIDFEVGRGETFGFLGPNGAGKSTTIKMLCTLLTPSGGRAIVNGYDVVRESGFVRQSIGIVFQEPTLDEYLSAEQNLRYHCMIYHTPRNTRDARIREVLQLVGLDERRKDLVKTFSGGMKRRLEVARGLLHQPQTLFLDEPTVGLDPQTRRSVWEYVLRLREATGLTIFMTTHYMEEAEYCDRIGVIDNGRIVALDTSAALKRMVGQDILRIAKAMPYMWKERMARRWLPNLSVISPWQIRSHNTLHRRHRRTRLQHRNRISMQLGPDRMKGSPPSECAAT